MRVVLTTVKKASVSINKKTVATIEKGFLLLVGFANGDNEGIVSKMVDKILSLRVFPDENGQTNISLKEVNGSLLSVSQFTLYADVNKGRRPSFVKALNPNEARKLYDYFNDLLAKRYGHLEKGVFQEDMEVFSINEGPFTLLLDSKELNL